jgi:hypothetical protein
VRTVKALFDQGIDPRILLMLFFSEYDGPKPKNQRFFNNTQCVPGKYLPTREAGCWLHMYDYLDNINMLVGGKIFYASDQRRELEANVYQALTPIGGPLYGILTSKDNLQDLRQIDQKKFKLKGTQLYSVSDPQLAICRYDQDHRLHSIFLPSSSALGDAICNQDEVVFSTPPKKNAGLTVRSPYEILQYLGQVLRYQEEAVPNRCITLDPNRNVRRCDEGEVLFQINAPTGTPVVTTKYGDSVYVLSDRACSKLYDKPCDFSLQVLAILELLINENKAAKDIISTPRVQVVQ